MKKLEVFAGPCVLESWELASTVAAHLVEQEQNFEGRVQITFKGSYDKANRTSIDSYRGPGMTEGLDILSRIKDQYKLPVLTDIHSPEQAAPVARVADVLQIPAFLCRQTDLIVAAAEACAKFNRRLKIKKGQFLAPEQINHLVAKVSPILPKERILITERGSCFGHGGLVVDMAVFQTIKSHGVTSVYDATHSVQQPTGKTTHGRREQIPVLARAAIAAGADSVFMEVHPDPSKALSDAATQLPLEQFRPLVTQLLTLYQAVNQ